MMFGPRTQSSPTTPSSTGLPHRVANRRETLGAFTRQREPVILRREPCRSWSRFCHPVTLEELAVQHAMARRSDSADIGEAP